MGTETTRHLRSPPRTTTTSIAAWQLIMGEEFHYGFFESDDTPLERGHRGAHARACVERASHRLRRPGARRRMRDRVARPATSRPISARRCSASPPARSGSRGRGRAGGGRAAWRAPTFEQRDGTDNGLDDGTFDVVWVLESSHLMRDKTACSASACASSPLGAGSLLCDIIRKRDIPFLEVRARRDDFALLRRAFGDAHMEPLEDYASTLARLGMTITDASDISAAHAADVRRLAGQRRHGTRTPCGSCWATRASTDFVELDACPRGLLEGRDPRLRDPRRRQGPPDRPRQATISKGQ